MQAASAVGTDEFYDELEHILHSGDVRVSPAAGTWLRRYGIMPNLVEATQQTVDKLISDVNSLVEANVSIFEIHADRVALEMNDV